jgi:hypothetical protein
VAAATRVAFKRDRPRCTAGRTGAEGVRLSGLGWEAPKVELGRRVVAFLFDASPNLMDWHVPAREGRFDCLRVESTGVSEPLPAAETRLGPTSAP